jgi:hypothetical protein
LTGSDDPRLACEQALGQVRSRESRLFPAPDRVIEDAARTWISAVTTLYTRCHTEGAHRELDADAQRVERIAREIDALVASARD